MGSIQERNDVEKEKTAAATVLQHTYRLFVHGCLIFNNYRRCTLDTEKQAKTQRVREEKLDENDALLKGIFTERQ